MNPANVFAAMGKKDMYAAMNILDVNSSGKMERKMGASPSMGIICETSSSGYPTFCTGRNRLMRSANAIPSAKPMRKPRMATLSVSHR